MMMMMMMMYCTHRLGNETSTWGCVLCVRVTSVMCRSVLWSATVLASCQTRTLDNVATMVINFMLSTHCVLMNVMCPQPSTAALIHSTDDDDVNHPDDDDDSWYSSSHCVRLQLWFCQVYIPWRSGLCLRTLITTTWLRSLIDISIDSHNTYDDDDDINCPWAVLCWSTTTLGYWWGNCQRHLKTWDLIWYCTLCRESVSIIHLLLLLLLLLLLMMMMFSGVISANHWGLTFLTLLPLWVPVTVMCDMQKNIRIELATLLLYHRKKKHCKQLSLP